MGNGSFMQATDKAVLEAKQRIPSFFVDKYNRPKKTPYYVTQLETLLESEFFPWIVYKAASQLVEDGSLSKIETSSKFHDKIVFFIHPAIDTPAYRLRLETRIKSICNLIDRYSKPEVGRALGRHLEGLVKAELRAQGFKIIGTHTSKYNNKEWSDTEHDLDFIAEHVSGKLTVGVEVKNTLPIIPREELDIKLRMCEYLEITPLLAVRWIKPYVELVRGKGGFCWFFKTQIYPLGFEQLTKLLYDKLGLPVSVRTDLPEKSIGIFQGWVESRTTI